jgi:hypothetical protein
MARFSAAGRGVTNLPTAVRGPALFAGATTGAFWVREVGIFNTTTSAVAVGLAVCTAQGTGAGGLTEFQEDDPSAPATGETAFTSQSTDSTVSATIRQASLGAAIGSGVIWTFGERGLEIAEGTGNGVIVNCPTGTAQFLDFYFVWAK